MRLCLLALATCNPFRRDPGLMSVLRPSPLAGEGPGMRGMAPLVLPATPFIQFEE